MRLAAMLVALSLVACSGLFSPATEATVAPPVPGAPCCSVDDVIRLTSDGVATQVIIDTLHTSQVDLDLSADDLVKLSAAHVDALVIDTLNGGPCVCEPPPPEPVAGVPAAINVTVKYGGGATFELVNLSTRTYTDLRLVANGHYQYRLKKLPAGTSDSVRLSTFVSTTDGTALHGDLTTLAISSDQGAWSKTF